MSNQMVDTGEPVPYMERTRQYYRALGYAKDYVWARHDEVPFAKLPKPLSECRLALITTAGPVPYDGKPVVVRSDRSGARQAAHRQPRLGQGIDPHRRSRSFLPIEVASKLARDGVFAGLAPRFHGVPTDYSQRSTTEDVAPKVLQRLRDDGADGAILCPL